MKKILLAAAAAATLFATSAFAHDFKLGDLKIEHPWARASATKQAKAGGAYMTIHNMGAEDKLVSVSSPAARKVELHTHSMNADGVMKMGQVPFVPVPAHGMAALKPGSYHVMFMGLEKPFVKGETFDLTLKFEKAGEITVEVKVESVAHGAGEKKSDDHMNHGGS